MGWCTDVSLKEIGRVFSLGNCRVLIQRITARMITAAGKAWRGGWKKYLLLRKRASNAHVMLSLFFLTFDSYVKTSAVITTDTSSYISLSIPWWWFVNSSIAIYLLPLVKHEWTSINDIGMLEFVVRDYDLSLYLQLYIINVLDAEVALCYLTNCSNV